MCARENAYFVDAHGWFSPTPLWYFADRVTALASLDQVRNEPVILMIERAAKNAGHDVTVPFVPGRTDALQEQTDVESFAVLEPIADGFRNYLRAGEKLPAETLLLDRAELLTLTAPEMTVLIGGMRALNANVGQSRHGVLTDRPETLTNDFFVNLLDMSTDWRASVSSENVYEGRDRCHGRGQVDRHRRRPRLRFELPAASHLGGVRM